MYQFKTSLKWAGDQLCHSVSTGKPMLNVTPPPEFGGPEGTWTPEDLLVSAIESCMLLTALSVAQKQKIALQAYESTAVGHMEKTPEGLRFTGVDISVTATVAQAGDADKAKKAILIAEKYCPVSNAVKFPVHLNVDVRA